MDNLTLTLGGIRARGGGGRPVRLSAGDLVVIQSTDAISGGEVELRVNAQDRDGAGGVTLSSPLMANSLNIFGGGGNDVIRFQANAVAGIRQPTTVNGGGGTDSLTLDRFDAADNVLHIGPAAVGGVPGDNFFAPGFAGGVAYDAVETVEVQLGNGNDTAFVLPSATTAFNVHGRSQAAAGQDRLVVATAAASNPVHTPGAAGAGTFTFSNRQRVTYTGFEAAAADAAPPAVGLIGFNFAVAPQHVLVDFTEDVSSGLAATTWSWNRDDRRAVPAASLRHLRPRDTHRHLHLPRHPAAAAQRQLPRHAPAPA